MKILLINPDVRDGRGYLSYNDGLFKRLLVNPSMTMPYIAALTPSKHQVIIRDEVAGDYIDYDMDVDLVGITVITQIARRAYEIATAFRKRGKIVVLGGAHITLIPDEGLMFSDSVVIGEAEDIWQQLLNDFEQNKLKKKYARSDLHNLCDLPKPKANLLRHKYKYFGVSMGQVKVSRGCPFACTTCAVPELYGRKYRYRPIRDVLCEIESMDEDIIYFCEDNIVGNDRYAKELFRSLIPMKKKWTSLASISIAERPDLLYLAAKSGCKEIYLGFESLSEESLRTMGKKHNINRNYKKIVKNIRDEGIVLTGGFLVGLDGDSPDVFKRTVDFIFETDLDICQFYIVVPWLDFRHF
jgi:radical SAM superfamily enzyme YgiQ (UPF0313 family)